MFSRLSVYVRKNNVECRSELYEAFKCAYKFKDTGEPPKCEHLDSIINYSQWMEGTVGVKKFSHYAYTKDDTGKKVYNAAGLQHASDIRHFKYVFQGGKTSLYTCESAGNQVWTLWEGGDFLKPTAPTHFDKTVPPSLMSTTSAAKQQDVRRGARIFLEKKLIKTSSADENDADIADAFNDEAVPFKWPKFGKFIKENSTRRKHLANLNSKNSSNNDYELERQLSSNIKQAEKPTITKQQLIEDFQQELEDDDSIQTFAPKQFIAYIQEYDPDNGNDDASHRFLVGQVQKQLAEGEKGYEKGELVVHQYQSCDAEKKCTGEYGTYKPLLSREDRYGGAYTNHVWIECVLTLLHRPANYKKKTITINDNEKDEIEVGLKKYSKQKTNEENNSTSLSTSTSDNMDTSSAPTSRSRKRKKSPSAPTSRSGKRKSTSTK
jgi:hypothetical protein